MKANYDIIEVHTRAPMDINVKMSVVRSEDGQLRIESSGSKYQMINLDVRMSGER